MGLKLQSPFKPKAKGPLSIPGGSGEHLECIAIDLVLRVPSYLVRGMFFQCLTLCVHLAAPASPTHPETQQIIRKISHTNIDVQHLGSLHRILHKGGKQLL